MPARPCPPQDSLASRPAVALAVLTGVNTLNYLDRFLLSPLLPLIIAGLGLSDGQAGSLQSAFILVFALISPLAGWLGDRVSRLRVAAVGVALWSIATFASGLAPSFAWLLLARALVGVGEGSYTVVTPSLLADHYPPVRRARVLSIFYAAIPFGIFLDIFIIRKGSDLRTHRIATIHEFIDIHLSKSTTSISCIRISFSVNNKRI